MKKAMMVLKRVLEIVIPMFGAAEIVWFIVSIADKLRWSQLLVALVGMLGLVLICPMTETVWKRLAFYYGLRKEVLVPMNFGRLWPILFGVAVPFFRIAYFAPVKTMAEIIMRILEIMIAAWCVIMTGHGLVRAKNDLQDEEKSTP